MRNPQLTICILHYRKLPKLRKTINHIRQNTTVPYKVKILNQGFVDDDIKKYLSTLEDNHRFEIIYGNKNLGPAAGRYILFQNLQTPYILSLDDDIYLPKNWFKSIKLFLETRPEVMIVGLSLSTPDGRRLPTARDLIVTNGVLKIQKYVEPPAERRIENSFYEVQDVAEGAMVIRKEMAEKLVWDKELTVCFEGFDLALQRKNFQGKVCLYTGKVAVHDSISKNPSYKDYNEIRRNYKEIRKNYIHFTTKWKLRFPFIKHLFYKYVCKVFPNSILKPIAYLWLNRIKVVLRKK